MKGRLNVQKCTLCVCVLTLILVCVLLYQRNVTEGFEEKVGKGKFVKKNKVDDDQVKSIEKVKGQGKYVQKFNFDDGQGKFIEKGKFLKPGSGQGKGKYDKVNGRF